MKVVNQFEEFNPGKLLGNIYVQPSDCYDYIDCELTGRWKIIEDNDGTRNLEIEVQYEVESEYEEPTEYQKVYYTGLFTKVRHVKKTYTYQTVKFKWKRKKWVQDYKISTTIHHPVQDCNHATE